MCKFTYFGYDGCKFPKKHYLVRREMCPANAKILVNAVKAGEKGWCSASLQKETPAPETQVHLPLSCPLCSSTPVVYEQPLLEMFQLFLGISPKSPMPKLPAPHYHHDKHTGTKTYSRFPKTIPSPDDSTASLFPAPLSTPKMHERSTSGSITPRAKPHELEYILPATVYTPPPSKSQALMITPPSSRDSSRSPPSRPPSRRDDTSRPPPPRRGGSRHELDALREKGSQHLTNPPFRPVTPASDRGRSSSTASNTSYTSSSSRSYTSQSRSPPQDRIAALKGIAHNLNPSRSTSPSPERGRRMRRDRAGPSERDGKVPANMKPKISPPVLGPNTMGLGDASGAAVEPFQQRLVPPQPVRRRNDDGGGDDGKAAVRPKTPHAVVYSTFPKAQDGDYPSQEALAFASASSGLGVGFGKDKPLPVPAMPVLRRIQTGQVRLVEGVRRPSARRQVTTTGSEGSVASASHKLSVKTGNFFTFGVGGKAQEFEIVSADREGVPAPLAAVYGQAF